MQFTFILLSPRRRGEGHRGANLLICRSAVSQWRGLFAYARIYRISRRVGAELGETSFSDSLPQHITGTHGTGQSAADRLAYVTLAQDTLT